MLKKEPSDEKPADNYVSALDGLRGIAIAAVMVFHAWEKILPGGFIGVDIFFVLSGFLVTRLLMREYEKTGSVNLKNFYIRRCLRLGPALLLFLAVFVVSSYLFLNRATADQYFITSFIPLLQLANWVKAFEIDLPAPLWHTWSLSVEGQFYILWPFILLTLIKIGRSRIKVLSLVVTLALSVWALRSYSAYQGYPLERLYGETHMRADALLIGCALGIALSSTSILQQKARIQQALKWAVPIAVVGLSIVMLKVDRLNLHLYYWLFFVIAILSGVLILSICLFSDSTLKHLLTARWLVWTGGISYSLYLWHYPIYRALLGKHYPPYIALALGTPIIFAVATASSYFIEKPVMRLKKKFQGNVI